MTKNYSLTAQLWRYPGKAGWHFMTLPFETAQEIDYYFSHVKKGWGSLPVVVTVGTTSWHTSIFPDKKTNSYLLPVKTAVREKEKKVAGDIVAFNISLTD